MQLSYKLNKKDIDVFIISAKTPSKKFLNEYGYEKTHNPGVFKSRIKLIQLVTLKFKRR